MKSMGSGWENLKIQLALKGLILLNLLQVQVGEVMPFIEEILNSTQSIICDLQPQQVLKVLLLFFMILV